MLRHRNAIRRITTCNCVIDRFRIDVNEITDEQLTEYIVVIYRKGKLKRIRLIDPLTENDL